MKAVKKLLCFALSAVLLFQLCACGSEDKKKTVSGATVFQALKKNVDFDSKLEPVDDPEDLFVGLPEVSDITVLKGPGKFSDQLGLIEVEDRDDLDKAEDSVNKYLQDMYDSAYDHSPYQAEKFENVATWVYDVYVVFCITSNYTQATQIINNTVNKSTSSNSSQNDKPSASRWVFYTENLLRVEIQDNSVTVQTYDMDNNVMTQSMHCEKRVDGQYTYYQCSEGSESVLFVVINGEILAMIGYNYGDEPGLSTPFGNNYEQRIEAWGFAENSDDPLPNNLDRVMVDDMMSESGFRGSYTYHYYAESKMLRVSDQTGYGLSFYVESDGSCTYVEAISLMQQTNKRNPIHTGGNYVIVDTM